MAEPTELDLTSEAVEAIELTSTVPFKMPSNETIGIDFSDEPVGLAPLSPPDESPWVTPETKPFDHLEYRERARRGIAIFLLCIFSGVILAAFVAVLFFDGGDRLDKLLTMILSPLVALVGSALGFYFGTQSSKKSE